MKRISDSGSAMLSRRATPKAPSSLMEQAYRQLRREILSCRIMPGSEISETDVAERLSMSKTPVREALGRLGLEGFVRAIPRRGYQVHPLTVSDMNELLDARGSVDGGTIELAAKRITEQQLDELKRLADVSYEKSAAASLDHFISANREFHLAIVRATGNRRLVEITSRQLDEMERFFYIGAQARDINPEVHSDHHRIVQVLRKRDAAAARRMIVQHNEGTRRGLLEVIASGRPIANLAVG